MTLTFSLPALSWTGSLRTAVVVLALAAVSACGESKIHQAPARPAAEGADAQVALSWQAVPDATEYVIRWGDQTAGETGFSNEIKGVTDTTYVHTGLTNFHTYRYQLYARGKGGEGPGSVVVTAEPGPVPGSVE